MPDAALQILAPLQIIRKASFVAAPWKNGGGTTFEALRVPAARNAAADETGKAIGNAIVGAAGTASGNPNAAATGHAFLWRVSVAHIDASGPFSDFAGYDRKMVLLRGAGFTLEFADGTQKSLRRVGDLAEFDGGIGAFCELAAGPCVDLNLMVAKSLHASVRVVQSPKDLKIQASQFESTLIVGIEDDLLLTDEAGATARLEPWDVAVLSEPHTLSAPGAVFVAVISTTATLNPAAGINSVAALNH